ncbi:MAG: GDSL-type esterase/lipase family protein [Sporomusaceae bacterium]|nr:GDSL-type esterase/lipase family protein [Sporomusaceae bacterium]
MRLNQLLSQLLLLFFAFTAGSEGLLWSAAAPFLPVAPPAARTAPPLPVRQASVAETDDSSSRIAPALADAGIAVRLIALPGEAAAPAVGGVGTEGVPTSAAPKPLSLYPQTRPASLRPFLTWSKVTGAVYYELEIDAVPASSADQAAAQPLFVSREIFANGYHADLTQLVGQPLFWRVRGLDYDGIPVSPFSQPSLIVVDPARDEPLSPLPTALYHEKERPTPLYPVYYWIPLAGAAAYEVEVTSQPPENPGSTAASIYRIWSSRATGYGIYDDTPRSRPGTYYWRVRALDAQGGSLGGFSEAIAFSVNLAAGQYAASLGDSITHGGGAVSYSPADAEYSYQSYLSFPLANLGKSGDTAKTMLERFEQDVLPLRPRYLLILGGTNSLRGGVAGETVIAELAALRDKCTDSGIRPIFLTLPPINPTAIARVFQQQTAANWRKEFDKVNSFIRRQHYYIDLEPYFLDERRELAARFAVDGLHLDIAGKRLMGQVINQVWPQVTE